jgi:hypothetical protein
MQIVQLGQGWFEPQALPQTGIPYRWIGQKSEAFVYASEQTTVQLSFVAHNSFASPYKLRVAVNNITALETAVLELAPHEFTVTLQPGRNTLTFSVDRPPHSAASLGLGTDQREVSIGVSQLRATVLHP